MIKHCDWCDNNFETNSKNQIYCSVECRTVATKQKVIQRYKITKAKERVGKDRLCAGGCGTYLSVYNDNNFCDTCLINNKKLERFLKDIKDYFDYDKK